MIKENGHVSRKTVEEDRIAICPKFGCTHLEKIKPLKFGFLGFRKYPKCSKHKIPLVFVDEFIGNFIHTVNACLFDYSSFPPEILIHQIKKKAPDELTNFIFVWMYCNPIGRGAQIVSQYMDGLSRGYMRLLSRKQRKALQNEKSSRKHYEKLHLGLIKIANEYATFLQGLHEKYELFYDPKKLLSLSDKIQNILKSWLKDHLNTIKVENSIKRSEFIVQEGSLPVLKEEYDKILHAGTCVLLLGKSPSIVTKSIPAFELFSAYHEFLKADLCEELKKEDIKLFLEDSHEFLNIDGENTLDIQDDYEKDVFSKPENKEEENDEFEKNGEEIIKSSKINNLNLKQKVKNHLKTIHTSINCTQKQKIIICSKSLKILDELISRAENNEISIFREVNLKVIAGAIIYSVIISNKKMPKLTQIQIANIVSVSDRLISRAYLNYFKYIYPRIEFRFPKDFKIIRNKISLYFFDILREKEIEIPRLVLDLKENIITGTKTPKEFTQTDINILYKMVTQYQDEFIKFFTDLAEIIKQLIISSRIHKHIGAFIIIKDLAEFLGEKGVTLLLSYFRFYSSILEIFDFLKSKYNSFFPRLYRSQSREHYEEYRRIVSSKLKLYIMKNIYEGKYYKDGRAQCPDCIKEGLITNSYTIRLDSMEFHHEGDEKENKFTAQNLYNIFTKNRSNPHVLDDLINLMELERVRLICRNHHIIFHFDYYNFFIYLISWDKIFSLPAEEIYILIITSINNFRLTKNYSERKKLSIRQRILAFLKKRYIIENFYGEYCQTCGEFSTKRHLTVFQFSHENKELKTVEANRLYYTGLSCSEIAQRLENERGGYVCGNCHTVFDYEDILLIKRIYRDENIARKIFDDYKRVHSKFKPINSLGSIGNPLKKSININENFVEYLLAIYEISASGRDTTNKNLANFLKLDKSTFRIWFRRNKDFIENYVHITYKKSQKGSDTSIYNLTDKGKKIISLIIYFKEYYSSLMLDECKGCNLNHSKKCLAEKPNQCLIIREKKTK